MFELIISDKTGYIGFNSEQRGKNRDIVSVQRRSGFNRSSGSYGLKSWLGKISGTGFRVEEFIGSLNVGIIRKREGKENFFEL